MLTIILFCSVPWWAEVHIFVGFVLFYWILTPILYYTNVRSPPYSSLFPINLIPTFPDLATRLLPHRRKRTLRPLWPILQRHSCTSHRRQIRRSSLQSLFSSFPPSHLCHGLSPGFRAEYLCACAYAVVSWQNIVEWDEEDQD